MMCRSCLRPGAKPISGLVLAWVLGLLATAAPAAPETRVEPAIDAGVFDGPAASAPVITDNVRARLLAEQAAVEPGGTLDLALVLDIRSHWHTYWRNPGDSGEPPRIDWTLPDGVTAGPIRWPLPAPIPVGPLVNYGYSDRAVHLVEIRLPADWPDGEPVPISAAADWLVCEEACIPEQGRFSLALSTDGSGTASPSAEVRRLFADARAELPEAGVVAASLPRGSDALRLRVPAAALPAVIDDAYFYPDAWGLVNHAAPQRWQREAGADGGDLLLTLTPGDAAGSVPATGLLKVASADGAVGLRLDATAAAAPGETAPAAGSVSSAASAGAHDLGLPLALAFALLGGLVLNLMPCVFPVLAIKALGLAGQGGARLSARALHGVAYTPGVIAFFLALGLLLLALRAGGAAVGWGFQLQSPLFVTLMAYLFVVLGMSLAGALTLGTGLMGIGPGVEQGMGRGGVGQAEGHLGAFVTGALAALVAAPCTAPFMGAALGYAMTVPWPAALAIVLALGLGMALPFLLLALAPGLARRLPRPGPASGSPSRAPVFATAAWLLWVLAVQTGPGGLAAALTGMLVLAFALWVQERTRCARSPWPKIGVGTAALGLGVALWLGLGLIGREPAPPALAADNAGAGAVAAMPAEPYSAERLAAARADGRPVFVNMTAAWCITCLVNERVALSRAAVARAFAERGVLYLKGDWTNRDPAITDYLAGFGRNGVPIYVFYPPDGEPRVLPQVLTEATMLRQLGAG